MGKPVAADIQGVGSEPGERSLPAGEVIVSTEASVSPAASGASHRSGSPALTAMIGTDCSDQ